MTVVLHVNYEHLFDLSEKQHNKLKQQQLALINLLVCLLKTRPQVYQSWVSD